MQKRATIIGISALAIISVLLTVASLTVFSMYLKKEKTKKSMEKELGESKEQITLLKGEIAQLKDPDQSKLCDMIRTFRVVSHLDFPSALPDETFVVLTSFQSFIPFIMKITPAQKSQLVIGEFYEFDLNVNAYEEKESPYEALRTAKIKKITYTTKRGFDQVQTACQ